MAVIFAALVLAVLAAINHKISSQRAHNMLFLWRLHKNL
jgi:hypothetical protein